MLGDKTSSRSKLPGKLTAVIMTDNMAPNPAFLLLPKKLCPNVWRVKKIIK
jgi:hypothetical protein